MKRYKIIYKRKTTRNSEKYHVCKRIPFTPFYVHVESFIQIENAHNLVNEMLGIDQLNICNDIKIKEMESNNGISQVRDHIRIEKDITNHEYEKTLKLELELDE